MIYQVCHKSLISCYIWVAQVASSSCFPSTVLPWLYSSRPGTLQTTVLDNNCLININVYV